MMAVVGYIIGESTPTIAYGTDIHHTIANDQIPEIPRAVLFPFFLVINIAEALRASKGWVEPGNMAIHYLRYVNILPRRFRIRSIEVEA
jgi:hypothetical protein